MRNIGITEGVLPSNYMIFFAAIVSTYCSVYRAAYTRVLKLRMLFECAAYEIHIIPWFSRAETLYLKSVNINNL